MHQNFITFELIYKRIKMKNSLLYIIINLTLLTQPAMAKHNTYNFLVGTYTNNTNSKGIYNIHCDFNQKKITAHVTIDSILDPSYLCLSTDKKFLYSISERGEKSSISSYHFDQQTGEAVFINRVAGYGADPCYVAVSDKHVITANYSGGNVCVFGRNKDGALTDIIQNIQHEGKSIDPNRQNKPHVHQAIFSPDKKFVLVNDLGTDFVTSYSYNPDSETNVLTEVSKLKLKEGSGPRHLAFSKNAKHIYVLQEMDGTVTTISIDNGKLQLVDETTVIRKENIVSGAADIHISPDGKFLYATNRGNANDISVFSIRANGKIQFVEQISVNGIGPRNFAITSDGKFILVANQKTNQVIVFNRNKKSGKLTDAGVKIDLPSPVCLVEY